MDSENKDPSGLRLNLGCGFKKKPGFVNVDINSGCMPDVCLDLTKETWPWADCSVDEVEFDFSLEEMGSGPQDLLRVLKETYRVCKPGARVFIRWRHPRHDRFLMNPLCVQRISPQFLSLLSVQRCLDLIANGEFDTPLALYLGVNFLIRDAQYLLDIRHKEALESGGKTEEELRQRMMFENNICEVMEVELVTLKREGREDEKPSP